MWKSFLSVSSLITVIQFWLNLWKLHHSSKTYNRRNVSRLSFASVVLPALVMSELNVHFPYSYFWFKSKGIVGNDGSQGERGSTGPKVWSVKKVKLSYWIIAGSFLKVRHRAKIVLAIVIVIISVIIIIIFDCCQYCSKDAIYLALFVMEHALLSSLKLY